MKIYELIERLNRYDSKKSIEFWFEDKKEGTISVCEFGQISDKISDRSIILILKRWW